MSFLKTFSFKRLFSSKRFSIPFSIVIAFLLWLSLTIVQKPTMERSFSDMTVTINMENTFASENEMSIIGDISQQKFTVMVQGPNSAVSSLTTSDVVLYASAASVDSPGKYKLDVLSRNASGMDYEVLHITPSTITVDFDYIETREFTITASAEGASASDGLIAEEATVSGTENNTITITGPRTVVNSIALVQAKATVNQVLSASQTFEAGIVLLDEKNKEIDTTNLTLSTEEVSVTVPISKKKTVPVKVDFSNVPSGFDKTSIQCTIDHPEVTIIGSPDTIDKTTQVTLSPIDLTTLSAKSQSFELSPKLTDGVRLLDSIPTFVVKINLDNYAEKTVTVSSIKYTGLSANLKTSGSASIKNVKICGPSAMISRLDTSKIYAETSLSDKAAGEHTVNVSINFEGYNNIWAEGSYKTTVTIK